MINGVPMNKITREICDAKAGTPKKLINGIEGCRVNGNGFENGLGHAQNGVNGTTNGVDKNVKERNGISNVMANNDSKYGNLTKKLNDAMDVTANEEQCINTHENGIKI